MYRLLFILLAALAIIAGLLLGSLNSEPVTLDLLFIQLNWPLGLIAVLLFSIGIVLGIAGVWLLAVLPMKMAQRRDNRELETLRTDSQAVNHD